MLHRRVPRRPIRSAQARLLAAVAPIRSESAVVALMQCGSTDRPPALWVLAEQRRPDVRHAADCPLVSGNPSTRLIQLAEIALPACDLCRCVRPADDRMAS